HTRFSRDWSSDVCSSDLAVADVPVSRVYRLRRTDPDFARQWYGALAEGYDNLEMELLAHLRRGESAEPSDTPKRKFDTAAALRRSEERRVGKEGRARWAP